MCLLLPLKVLFLAVTIAALLSQYNDTDGIGLSPSGIFAKKFFNYSVLEPANSIAINSESVEELVKIVCSIDFHILAPP